MYDPGWNESARTLAAALGGVKMVPVKGLKGTLKVVLGHDSPTVVAVYVPTTSASPSASTKVDGVTTAGKVQCLTGA
jgi:hypothetical protein